MAYQVNKFNGIQLTSVAEGTIDTSTDLTFIGKNYAGYGEVQNENFLHLLESFSNATQPPRAIQGQLWYDTSVKKLKVYDDEKFKVAGGAEFGSIQPANPARGDLWFNSTTLQLYAWDGTTYKLIGPDLITGQSAVSSITVTDTNSVSHKITTLSANGKVILVLNQDAEFELQSSVIPDFTSIKQGVTLAKSASGVSLGDWIYWGTAYSAKSLVVNDIAIPAVNFMQKDNVTFDNVVRFKDPGFTVGNDDDLSVLVNGDQLYFQNQLGNPIIFKIADSTATQGVLVIDKQAVIPGNSNLVDLGTPVNKWATVHTTNVNTSAITATGTITAAGFSGNVTGNVTGNVLSTVGQHAVLLDAATGTFNGTFTGNVSGNVSGTSGDSAKLAGVLPNVAVPTTTDKTSVVLRSSTGEINATKFNGSVSQSDALKIADYTPATPAVYATATITTLANTIAVRDSSMDITANKFKGTATQAQYADLAEKYLTDVEYQTGTVVSVGGAAEVTACNIGDFVVGVVSKNPAFMMNSGLENGTYIALKGRVPVLVNGPISKGDRLTAGVNGTATSTKSPSNHVFAIALESSNATDTRLIEAIVL